MHGYVSTVITYRGGIKMIYQFSARSIDGESIDFERYRGKVLLIVNTASKCGFTPQFIELQDIYEKYRGQDFEILGFPCNQFLNQEPGANSEIKNFCALNYGVSFQMFEKIDVNGENAHPLFKYLQESKSGLLGGAIKWNFTKFLIDREGNVVERYAPTTSPSKIVPDIELLLKRV